MSKNNAKGYPGHYKATPRGLVRMSRVGMRTGWIWSFSPDLLTLPTRKKKQNKARGSMTEESTYMKMLQDENELFPNLMGENNQGFNLGLNLFLFSYICDAFYCAYFLANNARMTLTMLSWLAPTDVLPVGVQVLPEKGLNGPTNNHKPPHSEVGYTLQKNSSHLIWGDSFQKLRSLAIAINSKFCYSLAKLAICVVLAVACSFVARIKQQHWTQ